MSKYAWIVSARHFYLKATTSSYIDITVTLLNHFFESFRLQIVD
jgi:hypothetical protein